MCETVTTEEEVSVVVASLEAISDMLKECKQDLTSLASHPEHIVLCITKIMKVTFSLFKKITCKYEYNTEIFV